MCRCLSPTSDIKLLIEVLLISYVILWMQYFLIQWKCASEINLKTLLLDLAFSFLCYRKKFIPFNPYIVIVYSV